MKRVLHLRDGDRAAVGEHLGIDMACPVGNAGLGLLDHGVTGLDLRSAVVQSSLSLDGLRIRLWGGARRGGRRVSLGVAVVGAAVLWVASTDGVGPARTSRSRGQNFQAATAPPDSRTRAATMGTTMRAALRFARLALATISPPGSSVTRANLRYRGRDGEFVSASSVRSRLAASRSWPATACRPPTASVRPVLQPWVQLGAVRRGACEMRNAGETEWGEPMDVLHVDCDSCVARGDACGDCVISVLLGAPDQVELDAVGAFSAVGAGGPRARSAAPPDTRSETWTVGDRHRRVGRITRRSTAHHAAIKGWAWRLHSDQFVT